MNHCTNPPNLLRTTIINLNSQLQGVSADTKLTFRYTDVGDEVSYEQRGKGRNKFAKVESILRENQYNPPCKHFADCGGCSGQHIPYERQFAIKTNEVIQKLQTLYGLTPNLVPASMHYNYRNRMDFSVFPGFIGLRQAENFRRIIDITHCDLQSSWANRELTQLRNLISEKYSDLALDRRVGSGYLKYITLRTNTSFSDTMSIFTFTEEFEFTELEKEFCKEVLNISLANNILFCYNRKQSEVSADGKCKVIKGNSYYKEDSFNKAISVPFNSFFQPNPNGFLPIIRFIENMLEGIIADNKRNTLIDLFCGNGFFSILFGEKFETIIGFDWVENSIQTANENLTRIYPDKRIQFEKKDLLQFKDVFSSSSSIPKNSILIMDPPRNGIGMKLSEYILESELQSIFYVSCNPNSQLEDMEILSQKYQIEAGLITDPYPQTPHLESVLFLSRKEK